MHKNNIQALIGFANAICSIDAQLIECGMFKDRNDIKEYREEFQRNVEKKSGRQVTIVKFYLVLDELLLALTDLTRVTKTALFATLEGRLIYARDM